MRKCKYIFIILIVLCSLCVCVYAENITGLQEESEQLSEELSETNNRLQVVQNEISSNMKELQGIDSQISEVQENINKINDQIEELTTQIKEHETNLEKIQKEADEIKDLLDARLIAMYKAPKLQNLNILINSESISDFIGNYYALKELTEYDTKLLETAKKQKQEIETTKTELAEKQQQIIKDKQTQQKQKQVLANTKTMRNHYISKLTKEEKELQTKVDEYNAQIAEIEAEIKLLASNSKSEEYIGGTMIWPVPGYSRITSKYGMRVHPITGAYKLHNGIDVAAPIGANFVAVADGVVTKACYNYAYGNMVIIDHGGGVQTLYAHGSKIVAQLGQKVRQGDVILKVGSTGYSTGPHAHFEVRIDGKTVNPLEFVTNN